jgi:hypothetical protein
LFVTLSLYADIAFATTFPLSIINSQAVTIYVSFNQYGSGATYQGSWVQTGGPSGSCVVKSGQLVINIGVICTTNVDTTFGISRICASETYRPSGFNCANSQQHNRTLVELTFGNSTATGCIGSDATCTWYDISVIPSSCTNRTWDPEFGGNFCANTGGAAYNLPVRLSCSSQPTFKCQGPGSLGAAHYLSACGMTTLKTTKPGCIGQNGQGCYQAHF